MQEQLLKKTENQLYRYFEYKRKIRQSERRVEDLDEQIRNIDNQMRNVHKYIHLDTMPPSVGCGERVQTSISGTSYMEKQMEQEVTKLEKRKIQKIKSKIKTENKIADMRSFIRNMDTNIEYLSEEDKRFIEFFYGAKKKIPYISMQLNLAIATCYRRKDEIVNNIGNLMWIFD